MRHVVKHDNDNSDNEDDDEVMPMTKNMMLMRIMGMNMSRTTKGTTLMMYYDNGSITSIIILMRWIIATLVSIGEQGPEQSNINSTCGTVVSSTVAASLPRHRVTLHCPAGRPEAFDLGLVPLGSHGSRAADEKISWGELPPRELTYCWWKKSCTSWCVVNPIIYLQGFIHPRWCRISSINSIPPLEKEISASQTPNCGVHDVVSRSHIPRRCRFGEVDL